MPGLRHAWQQVSLAQARCNGWQERAQVFQARLGAAPSDPSRGFEKLLTVVFSSFNGERTLETTLSAFCQLLAPAEGWKLIAVDNGSADRTMEILQTFAHRLPMQVLSVSSRGKNFALNEAIDHAVGDLVVFTDDDVVPDPDWLCELQDCARAHPECGIFGGPIVPRWPRPPEAWTLKDVPLGMVYASSDPGLKEGPVDVGFIWGPNMAIKRSLFDGGFRFNTTVGPDGTMQYAMGSESELTTRLARNGVKSWFCAAAKVEHLVREYQLSKQWVLQRFFRYGRSLYLFGGVQGSGAARIFGAERWLYRRMWLSLGKALGLRLLGQADRAFICWQTYHQTRGMIFQSRLMQQRNGVG